MSGSPRSVLEPANGSKGLTALVVGAGIAGLLSTHVACQEFERVVLVEGDATDRARSGCDSLEGAKQRRGIPQYLFPHTLAMGGLQAMEHLLPGFRDELLRRGGLDLDLARDFRFFDFGATYTRASESELKSVGASRHLIQTTLQEEVLRRNEGRLQVLDGHRVAGLLWSDDKQAVLGVELGGGERLEADLTIVASGRYSRMPQWLQDAGYAPPPVQKVDAALVYVGRLYRVPQEWPGDWKGCITFGRPSGLRGAGMVPVEGQTWQMVAWGLNGVLPPTDEGGFLEYVRTLPDDAIYQAISRAEPKTSLMKHGGACNVQRGYDRIPLPAGVIVIGDAVQALNPVYAQGMSVAAKGAEALEAALASALKGNEGASLEVRRAAVRGMGPAFQRQLAGVIAPCWMMAASEDQRYAKTKSEGAARPSRLMAAYIDALFKACHYDTRAMETVFGVAHMVHPPHHLFHPRLLAAAAWELAREAMATLQPFLPALPGGASAKADKAA